MNHTPSSIPSSTLAIRFWFKRVEGSNSKVIFYPTRTSDLKLQGFSLKYFMTQA